MRLWTSGIPDLNIERTSKKISHEATRRHAWHGYCFNETDDVATQFNKIALLSSKVINYLTDEVLIFIQHQTRLKVKYVPQFEKLFEVIWEQSWDACLYKYTKQKIVTTWQVNLGQLCFINDAYK